LSILARTRILLSFALLSVVATVWFVVEHQRDTALAVQQRVEAVEGLRTAMIDQETGLRGYIQTRDATFLQPFTSGRGDYRRWLTVIERAVGGQPALRVWVVRQTATAARWQRAADTLVARLRAGDRVPPGTADAERRKATMDRFRLENRTLSLAVRRDGGRRLDRAAYEAVGRVLLVALLFGALGLWFVERRARVVDRRRLDAHDFAQALQAADDEREAHTLLQRHVERSIPDISVVVLTRNNSADRLTARTDVATPALRAALDGVAPRDCLAVRRGIAYEHGKRKPLQVCEICGTTAPVSLCVPTLVSGEVIGTVLTQGDRPLREDERQEVEDAVAQAAPVVANLRNLAIAEERASTDGLTSVPNARAVQETLGRMVAQASRQLSPLTAVMLDLDHFKSINDRYGHQTGDDVLAAVGQVLKRVPRASDFAGRWGGEEFLVLLPDTDAEGGFVLAEKLRVAIAGLAVPGLPVPVTASLGVATLPEHAATGQQLVRAADQALYAAKDAGRDQVHTSTGAERSPDEPERPTAVAATDLVDEQL
jgi:diguanylate cyclase (GGDEF)-like protein